MEEKKMIGRMEEMDLEEDFEEDLDLEKELNLLDNKEVNEGDIMDSMAKEILRLNTEIKELKEILSQQIKYTTELQNNLSGEREHNKESTIFKVELIEFITGNFVKKYRSVDETEKVLYNGTGYDQSDINDMNEAIRFDVGYYQALKDIAKILKLDIKFL